MVWYPGKGGKYDISAGLKAVRNITNPVYDYNAIKNVYNRVTDNGVQWSDFAPQTLFHAQSAQAADTPNGYGVADDSSTNGGTTGGGTDGTDGNNDYTDGGGGTGGSEFRQYFNGVLYTDPTAYTNAVNDTILTNYRNQQKKIEDLYGAGLISLEEKLQSARENATALKKSRDTSLSTVTGYYNRISPNAVQSAEADVRGNINQDYETNQKKIGGLFGDKKISDLQDADLTPYMNEISNTGSLARGLRDLKTNKQDYISDNESYRRNATDQTANNLMDYKAVLTPSTSTNDVVSDYLNNIASYFGTDASAQNAAFPATSKTTPSYFEGLDEYENR